jgi:hypothetical protein
VLALVVAAVLPTAFTAEALKHAPGCRSHACSLRVARWWGRHHRPPAAHAAAVTISAFDYCVANRENGEPGSTDPSFIHWHAINEYDGAYSFLPATWDEAGGQRYASRAYEATPEQQTIIFEHWRRIDPGAWPTIPPCLGEPGA